MNAMEKLEQQIKDKLAEHQSTIENHRNHLRQQMAEVDHRHEQYTALADRLTQEVIRPRLEKLASFFDNAEMVRDSEQVGRHQGVCVFKHTNRFPARARLELGLSHDRLAENFVLTYCTQILPIFFDFPKQDEKLMPLESVDDGKVAEWFDEKIVAFLDAYLRLETHQQYQSDNIVTDPVCGMPVNKLHAAVRMDHGGVTYYFCVEDCRKKFAAAPDHYITGKKPSR
ncbi:MAG: YHS domain-containing protein [Planctomycetes bacterium]|nr:YHS domain-containing protein [Planctomycetota bacterium]